MQQLILASGSPRRKELLQLIGVPFTVIKSEAEEEVGSTLPHEIVQELSCKKATEVAERITEGTILGADTIVWFEGKVLGKPKDREDAAGMLRALQGNAHEVYTGVTIIVKTGDDLQTDTFSSRTVVHVHSMSEEEIEAYLDTGDPFDKAGSYGIQGPFAAFVDGIEGDYQTVVGLPVSEVYRHLHKCGFFQKQ